MGYKLSEKARLFKNFIAYSVVFLLIYAGFDSIASIAPVLNQDGNLGTTSQAIIFVFQFFSALVLPQVIVEAVGFKVSLVIAEIFLLLFMCANAYPRWATMIPTSIIGGVANSIAWTNLGIYFTIISKQYSVLTFQSFENAQNLIFGWFTAIFLLCYILGATWVGGILQLKEITIDPLANISFKYETSCGPGNCPQTQLLPSTSKPTLNSIYALCGTFIAACVLSIILTILFIDDLKLDENLKPIKRVPIKLSQVGSKFKAELKNLIKVLSNVNMWLLIPLAFYLGYELTMIWYEFNRAFVTCIKNVNYIGWTNSVYGAVGAFISFFSGKIIKYAGLQTAMIIMLMTGICQSIFMISWTPNPNEWYVIFFMVAAFGLSNCLATGQIRAAFGIFFPDDPSAYSVALIFQTIGTVLGSILSIYFCTRLKAYIYMGIAFISMICYIILDAKTNFKKRASKSKNSVKGVSESTIHTNLAASTTTL